MVEDLHATKRYFSFLKSGYQLLKSYVKEWRYDSSTSKGARGQFHSMPQRQETQIIKETKIARQSESIHLLPGWAVRRYVDSDRSKFDLHVHVSGYATTQRLPQNTTRAQRAFLLIAKGFAALNKFAEAQVPVSGPTCPKIPPSEGPKDDELIENLDECFNKAHENLDLDINDLAYNDDIPPQSLPCPGVSDILLRWEDNLQSRMRLFWPTMLSSRVVHLELFISQESSYPVGACDVYTKADGTFHHHFHIKWDDICHQSLSKEHDLILRAKLLPAVGANVYPDTKMEEQVVTVTDTYIRVVSDIDDTVKMSNILSGARTVFRNVFVRDLEEITIPGMGEWYTTMWRRGVRFHYVSNGPIQLLPLILQFLHVAKLPSGSIRLKSYSARSLFNSLFTAPAERKRDGLVEILRCCQDSKFILIGDTGEQDLELYTQLASIYPTKILAILVRDVESEVFAIQDPCGKEWKTHTILRNADGSDENSGSSRSNSLLGMAFRDKFSAGRSNSRNRTGSFLNSHSPPPLAYTPLPPLSDDEHLEGSTSPIEFEPEPIISMDNQPLTTLPSLESPWFPSTLTHTSILSTSPPSDSPISQYEDVMSVSDNRTSVTFSSGHSRSTGGVDNDVEMVASLATIRLNAGNGRTTTVMFADEGTISQSPERTSFLRSDTGNDLARSTSQKRMSRNHGNRHRLHTVDDAVPLKLPRDSRRPRTPRRNTSSSLASGTLTTLSSTSVLSLPGMSRHRGMSESERRRVELQERVWRARSELPESIMLRIFRQPSECVEVDDILKGVGF